MKAIQPISLWVNGTQKQATAFKMISIHDNLVDTATFYYTLNETVAPTPNPENPDEPVIDTYNKLADGNLSISGSDYTSWSANPDINTAAYDWGATQLNLTLV
jgi:hypothetical protein